MQGFEKIVELLVTVVLLFFVPLQYAGVEVDLLNRTYVATETAYFVDAVRTTGRLTGQMYQEYLKKLGVTGEVYDIQVTHYQRLLNETEEGYQTYYHGVYTEEILAQLFSGEGVYDFLPGDFFRIQVNSLSPSMAEKFSLFSNTTKKREPKVQAIYGGRIRNEAG